MSREGYELLYVERSQEGPPQRLKNDDSNEPSPEAFQEALYSVVYKKLCSSLTLQQIDNETTTTRHEKKEKTKGSWNPGGSGLRCQDGVQTRQG